MSEYLVLIDCQNDKTGKAYRPGDIVTDGDFPKGVIANWLGIDPPVLQAVDSGEEE